MLSACFISWQLLRFGARSQSPVFSHQGLGFLMQHLAANMLRGPSALGTSLRGKDRVPRAALVAERPAAVLLSPLKGPPRQAAEHTTTVSYVEAPQVVADEYANERRELELTMGLAQLQQLTAELELALGGAEQAVQAFQAASTVTEAPSIVQQRMPDTVPVPQPSTSLQSAGPSLLQFSNAALSASSSTTRKRSQVWTQARAMQTQQTVSSTGSRSSLRSSVESLLSVFTEKGLLNISEEGQLVAAAQDWLHVEAQRDALAGVLKRNPTHEELSAALDMPSKSIQVRMFAGFRAYTVLVSRNYRLVLSIAKKIHPVATSRDSNLTMADLLSVGLDGMRHAIRKYQPEKGYRLSTYATWWIRQRVGRAVERSGIVRIPLARQLMCDRVRRASEELRAARTPISTASIAAHLGVAEYLVERAKTDMGLVITGSLDRKLGHDSEGTVADTLQDDSADTRTEAHLLNSDLEGCMAALLDRMPQQEAAVLSLRLGTDGGEEMSAQAVARKLNISGARVKVLEDRGLLRLRELAGQGGMLSMLHAVDSELTHGSGKDTPGRKAGGLRKTS